MRPISRLVPVVLVSLALSPASTYACGGVFSRPDEVVEGTDYHMVLALSATQTTFFDRIQYTGSPTDFAWVLPIPAPGTVALANAAFFEMLDRETHPVISGPPREEESHGCSFGFGAAGSDRATYVSGDAGVTIYNRSEVGPYEQVTLGSDDPNAVYTWLTSNGYNVPPAEHPLIDWYVARHWVFAALKLRPGAGAGQVQPVRVTYPGRQPTIPLHIMMMGGPQKVGIAVWVFADHRQTISNYPVVAINDAALRWNEGAGASNYRELFDGAVDAHGGNAFVVEYANPLPTRSLADSWTYVSPAARPDLEAALAGQPDQVWLTRLRTSISPAMLSNDMQLTAAPDTRVSNQHQATQLSGAAVGAMGLGVVAAALARRALRSRSRAR